MQEFLRYFCTQPIINAVCWVAGLPTYDQLNRQLKEKHSHIQNLESQQQALYRVITKIRASLELDDIFKTATKETCKLLQAERVAVYQFSKDWGGKFIEDFEFYMPGLDDTGSLGKNTVWDDSYLQEHQGGRYRQNECLAVNNIYKAGLSQCHIDILEQFQIRAYATAPIFIGSKLWGVLAAYQHSQPRHWQKFEVSFLAEVATQLGFAVKQVDLIANMQAKANRLLQNSEQQRILSNLIAEIRESIDLDILFRTTTREVRKMLDVDRVSIFKFDLTSNYSNGQFVSESVLPEFDSVIACRVRDHCFGEQYSDQYHQGRIQVLENIYDTGLKECHIEVLEEFQIKAQIIVPLMYEDSLWGLLCVHSCRSPRHWQPEEITFVKRLAAQFDVALSHANLLTQYRQKTEELNQTVAQLKIANQKLDEMARFDALTGIANRRTFDATLQAEWERLSQSGDSLSLILFDIDYFKDYNDCCGHPAGDKALVAVAHAAKTAVEQPHDLLARYGGEEFAVILPGVDESGAIAVVHKIQSAIEQLQIPHKGSPLCGSTLSVSLGVASLIPAIAQSPQILVEQADKALYQAKAEGRNKYKMFIL